MGRFYTVKLCFLYDVVASEALTDTDCEDKDLDFKLVELRARPGPLFNAWFDSLTTTIFRAE